MIKLSKHGCILLISDFSPIISTPGEATATESSVINPQLGTETATEARVRINNERKRKRDAKVLSIR